MDNNKKAEELVALLSEKKLTLATAESCTGGMIGMYITSVSGSSSVYEGGVISYSNAVKNKLLSVKGKTLDTFGAVSENTALEMARGARELLQTDISVAVTGIAGPLGATSEKPCGLVYIAVIFDGITLVSENIFKGNRKDVREQTVFKAFDMIKEAVTQKYSEI